MPESDLLKGSVTRAHLDASAPALAATREKTEDKIIGPRTPFCGPPGKGKPKAPAKKKPAKRAPATKKPAKKK